MNVPISQMAKRFLLDEMKAQTVGPSELARRMGILPQEVTRLLDLKHRTKIDTIEKAIHTLGKSFTLSVVDKEN